MSTSAAPAPVIARLRALFSDDPTNGQSANGAWDQAWKSETTPWDRVELNPALQELVSVKWSEVKDVGSWKEVVGQGNKALVAGCGRGHDVLYFAQQGLDTLGVDLSPTAVAVAEAEKAKLGELAPANARFEALNFYTSEKLVPASFTIAYDYTFICAMSRSMLPALAARYAELIKPGGLLIALIFPIDGDRLEGPPFSVSVDQFDALFSDNFERVYLQRPSVAFEGHENKQMMSVWKRRGAA